MSLRVRHTCHEFCCQVPFRLPHRCQGGSSTAPHGSTFWFPALCLKRVQSSLHATSEWDGEQEKIRILPIVVLCGEPPSAIQHAKNDDDQNASIPSHRPSGDISQVFDGNDAARSVMLAHKALKMLTFPGLPPFSPCEGDFLSTCVTRSRSS